MRYALTVVFIALATGAQAHPGHLTDLAGHDHWVAGAAIGAAVLAGLWGALKGKKEDVADAEPNDENDEVPA